MHFLFGHKSARKPTEMTNTFQNRVLAVTLALLTLAACVLAGFNLRNEGRYDVPTDGAWWLESSNGGLRAERVPLESPAYRAGVRTGDEVIAINDRPAPRVAPFKREQFRSGIWSHATYTILRPAPAWAGSRAPTPLDIQVILEPADRSNYQGVRLIALVYLLIGIYVLFRRWTAPKATHFYVFCLASFVLYAFKYTGEFDALDKIIFWGNVAAAALQPALFLHFAVTFSDSQASSKRHKIERALTIFAIYLPGLFLVGLQIWAMHFWSATERLNHRLDQIGVGHLALYYVIAAIVFLSRYGRAGSALERQQLKWLSRGTLLAVTPFTLMYAIPYMADWNVPSLMTRIAGLSLVFIPLTFSWAIVRYRLMDVDLIFKRGVTYTLATAALVALYFLIVAVTAEMVHTRLHNLGLWGLVAAITITGLVFDPLKRAIQGRVDRLFDQKRFDYRETLVEFGRGLNAQTDLRTLVDAIVKRLPQTLLITRVAVFLADEQTPGAAQQFHLAASHGLTNLGAGDLQTLDLRFLDFDQPGANSHIFLETPQHVLRLPELQRQSAARLDLNYYLPCRAANRERAGTRTVAVLGFGRTEHGDFLSSEDVELLESLASYIGIAIQNAQLYQRLEQKISEFERLKDFHENILESINVGVFAVDLDDHIESWNQQMEAMFGMRRGEALGQPLSALFPSDFVHKFNSVRGEYGTHTLYKFRLNLPNGEPRTANIAIAPLLTRDLTVIGRILLVDDITDRTQLEEQLTQAEKLSSIGLLAAGVAHEVNTPLAVISSYTQMLTKQMSTDKRVAPLLEKITQQSFRASEIVNGLLNFSRTGSTDFTGIDLNTLLRDTVTLVDHQLKTAGIHVNLELEPKLACIHGNQGKLQQVLLNLVMNAKDAMFHTLDARMRISTENAEGRVIVRIQDSGSGIKQEHLHRIYDPFFTTKTTPQKGGHKGTGLGLAVSYGIVQEHGGKILVESEMDIGTTFLLDFPAMLGRPGILPGTRADGVRQGERTKLHA